MEKLRLATIWLDGCSGCHMSFLDMDMRLLELADKVEVVFSPLVDTKKFPENVDICLVEGAISTDEDIEKIHKIRKNTKTLVAFGDCAITANIPSMRNPFGVDEMMNHVYLEMGADQPVVPTVSVPCLNDRARPLQQFVKVDVYMPGCPPEADTIHAILVDLIEGRTPDVSKWTRFGA